MDKHLQFHRGNRGDPAQFLERHLPLQNHPTDAECGRGCHPGRIVNAHLRGCVQHQLWKIAPAQLHHRQILHDQRVGTQPRQPGQEFRGLVQLLLPQQRVEREVDPASAAMRIREELPQLFGGKVRSAFSGIEFHQSAVDRVSPRIECGQRSFQISRWGKQLGQR